jgi:hypothetical protein
MTRPTLIAAIAIAACAAALFYAAPFQTTVSQPVTNLVPAGAQLCLEARDFHAELSAWNASPEKQRWLASRRYEGFSRSNLFFKLERAWKELSAAAGFVPGWDLADSLAGRESALAMYDIGEVQFLYVTRLPAAAAMQNALWKSRAGYESRHAGGFEFFVRTSGRRTVAFAAARDILIVASNEDYVAGSLRLLSGEHLPNILNDAWYKEPAAAAGRPGDFRLTMNLEQLVNAPQFRSYWIQRNATEIGQYSAALADIFRDGGSFREERVLLRKTAATAGTPAAEHLARLAPDDASFYRAWSQPRPDDLAALIRQKVFPAAPAPVVDRESDVDLEARIDLAPRQTPADQTSETLRTLLRSVPLTCALEVQTTEPLRDGVFINTPAAFAIESATPWPAPPMGSVHGNILLISSSPQLEQQLAARLNRRPASSNSTSLAAFRHTSTRAAYQKMMFAIDRTNGFFSVDLFSLSEIFRDINVAELRTQDEGSLIRETLNYRE